MRNVLLLLLLTMTLVSCGNSSKAKKVAAAYDALTGRDGSSSTVVAKHDTEMGDEWVVFEYFNLDGTHNSFEAVNLALIDDAVTDASVEAFYYGYCTGCDSTAYFMELDAPIGDLYTSWYNGNEGYTDAYVFEEQATAMIKDLEKEGAKIQHQSSVQVRDRLVSEFGLSADRATLVSKTLTAYRRLNTKRSLTSREMDKVAKDLAGVSYNSIVESVQSGNTADLLEKAAVVNGVSPEAMQAILENILQ